MVSENIFTAPPSPNGWKWCFQSKNRLDCNFWEILNLEGHQNCITGSRVTAILLKKWTFPIGQSGEASRWRVCYQGGLPCLVSFIIGPNLFLQSTLQCIVQCKMQCTVYNTEQWYDSDMYYYFQWTGRTVYLSIWVWSARYLKTWAKYVSVLFTLHSRYKCTVHCEITE